MVKYSKHKEATQVASRQGFEWPSEEGGGAGGLYLLTGSRPYLVVVIVGVSDGSNDLKAGK